MKNELFQQVFDANPTAQEVHIVQDMPFLNKVDAENYQRTLRNKNLSDEDIAITSYTRDKATAPVIEPSKGKGKKATKDAADTENQEPATDEGKDQVAGDAADTENQEPGA